MDSNSSSPSCKDHPPVSLDLSNVITAVVPYSTPPRPDVSPSPPVNQLAMVFLPIHSSQRDLERVLATTTDAVAVSGSAAQGKIGYTIGNIDISESEHSYMFRVGLPGVARDETFSWNIKSNGELLLNGVSTSGQKNVLRNGMEFEMLTQNLISPPGEFSILFQLPGPVDRANLKVSFGNNGIFEGIVKKRQS